jgi:hypothetical protein
MEYLIFSLSLNFKLAINKSLKKILRIKLRKFADMGQAAIRKIMDVTLLTQKHPPNLQFHS